MSDVMTFSKRTAAGLEEVLRTLLLDSENKVPAERLRIVGALTSGHIIESGSNANGNYVRFADGTQWCWGAKSKNFDGSERDPHVLVTFPAVFIDSNYIATMTVRWWPSVPTVLTGYTPAPSSMDCFLYGITGNPNNATIPCIWLAIGRWKA